MMKTGDVVRIITDLHYGAADDLPEPVKAYATFRISDVAYVDVELTPPRSESLTWGSRNEAHLAPLDPPGQKVRVHLRSGQVISTQRESFLEIESAVFPCDPAEPS